MTSHHERLQTLDQLLQERILPDLTPPYITARNLSRVALGLRKYLEEQETIPVRELYYSLPEAFFSLLFLKYHCGLPLERIEKELWSDCWAYPHLNTKNEDNKVRREGIEHKFATTIGLFHAPQRGKIFDRERRQVQEKEVPVLQVMDRLLHGSTKGLLPAKTHLSYEEIGTGLFIVNKPAFFAAMVDTVAARGTWDEEEKQRLYGVRCENFRLAILEIPKTTILDFVNYNYCDSDTVPDCFLKWINPARVEYIDQEIKIAQELKKKGFTVPQFYGYAIAGDNAFLIGERIEGVDFSTVHYSEDLRIFTLGSEGVNPFDNPFYIGHFLKYLGKEFPPGALTLTISVWKDKVAEAYQALGREVRKLIEAGVYCPDLARRNVMLRYVDRKPQIVPVDFERTQLKGELSSTEREQMLGRLEREFQDNVLEFEREEFYKGFAGKEP